MVALPPAGPALGGSRHNMHHTSNEGIKNAPRWGGVAHEGWGGAPGGRASPPGSAGFQALLKVDDDVLGDVSAEAFEPSQGGIFDGGFDKSDRVFSLSS